MKKIIVLIAVSIFAAGALAQDYNSKMQNDSKINSTYCAILKDGKMMLMAEGKQVNNDVTLADGTIVKTDGTVMKKDKTQTNLQNGDCIDQDGNIMPLNKKRSTKDKIKEENKDKKTDYK
jgi:uncharacterized protein YdeI (BOF family)